MTLYMTLSFPQLVASGTVLYVASPGQVANWSRSTLAALDRSGWQARHTVSVLLFVLAGAFHLWFNWRAFWFYVRARLAGGMRLRRELALAAASVTGARPQVAIGRRLHEPAHPAAGLGQAQWPGEAEGDSGRGRLRQQTMGEVYEQLEVTVDEGLAHLRARGIEASAGTR